MSHTKEVRLEGVPESTLRVRLTAKKEAPGHFEVNLGSADMSDHNVFSE